MRLVSTGDSSETQRRIKACALRCIILIVSCLQFSSFVSAETDYKKLLKDYYDQTIDIYDGQWSYIVHIDDLINDEIIIRSFNPQKAPEERQKLLSINGEIPSKKALAKFRKKARKDLKSEKKRRNQDSYVDTKTRFWRMLVQDSIKLEKQDEHRLYLSFKVRDEKLEDMTDHLLGTFIVDLKKKMITEVQIRNTAAFSPSFLVFIDTVFLSLRYSRINGLPMQTGMTWELEGDAYIFMDLDSIREVSWTDHQSTQ